MSGLGKGVIASSTGRLLRSFGCRVTAIKIDPYINIDAGTMSPFEHGEVFVLDDGGEADLDLGNYERFLDIKLTKDNNITTGKIYDRVIQKERKGEYLGKTVQVVPHICDEIQDWVLRVAHRPTDDLNVASITSSSSKSNLATSSQPTTQQTEAETSEKSTSASSSRSGSSQLSATLSAIHNANGIHATNPPDVCVIELGGTVGDIESMPFIEAMRQFQFKVGRANMCILHVSLVPIVGGPNGEQKTKPTQQSARDLRALGLIPDFIMCRSSEVLHRETQEKISSFCHVDPRCVIGVNDVSNIYRVPGLLYEQNMLSLLSERLSLQNLLHNDESEFLSWCSIADTADALKRSVQAEIGDATSHSNSKLFSETTQADLKASSDKNASGFPSPSKSHGSGAHITEVNANSSAKVDPSTSSPLKSSTAIQESPKIDRKQTSQNVEIPPSNGPHAFPSPLQPLVAKTIHIALVGKYTDMPDAYLSVIRALQHASYYVGVAIKIDWVEASDLEDKTKEKYESAWTLVRESDGILVPGGFGDRGIEGMILAAEYARTSGKPYFGICLGMQIAVIEAARHILNWSDANSAEFDQRSSHQVIIFMPEISRSHMGGTMRLGKRRTVFTEQCLASRLYKPFHLPLQLQAGDLTDPQEFKFVDERHRHRYEVNPQLIAQLEQTGVAFVGQDESGERQEIIEIADHPFFLAVQFHPEFLSRPNRPSPPFVGLLLASSGKLQEWLDVHQ